MSKPLTAEEREAIPMGMGDYDSHPWCNRTIRRLVVSDRANAEALAAERDAHAETRLELVEVEVRCDGLAQNVAAAIAERDAALATSETLRAQLYGLQDGAALRDALAQVAELETALGKIAAEHPATDVHGDGPNTQALGCPRCWDGDGSLDYPCPTRRIVDAALTPTPRSPLADLAVLAADDPANETEK